jgi:rhodanese-related sulfurtransferase
MVEQISVQDLKKRQDQREQFILVDVRNQNELDICKFETAVHIPLHEFAARYTELDAAADIVVTCHHGGRSQQAAMFLIQQGFRNVSNLVGGIEAWASQIDPEMARY